MNNRFTARVVCASVSVLTLLLSLNPVANGHHSFAMYDQTELLTLTGRITRFIPAPNHAQLIFEQLDSSGAPVLDENGEVRLWGVETGPATRIARQGVTPDNFPAGTIITVQLNALRDGRPFGALPNGRPLIHCGTEMPSGGCTAETGRVFLSENQ